MWYLFIALDTVRKVRLHFSYFSMKTYAVGLIRSVSKTLLMSTHIFFHGEIRKLQDFSGLHYSFFFMKAYIVGTH